MEPARNPLIPLLEALPDEWMKIARQRKPNDRYAAQCQTTLKRFAEFVQGQNPKAKELGQVTRTGTRAFLDAEADRGVTGKTWNDTLKLLPAGAINPFANVPTRETDTVFCIPFTPDELAVITEAARTDEFIRQIIITGIVHGHAAGRLLLAGWEECEFAQVLHHREDVKDGADGQHSKLSAAV